MNTPEGIPYPYLPEGRSFIYAPITDSFMAETKRITLELSTDAQHPTGALIIKDGKAIGHGANQSALKNQRLIKFHKEAFCVRRFLGIPSGQKYWLCPGCSSSRHHSERRAIQDARKNGFDANGADLYHWGHWWCCKPCWDAMIAAGIRNVYLVEGATQQFKR